MTDASQNIPPTAAPPILDEAPRRPTATVRPSVTMPAQGAPPDG